MKILKSYFEKISFLGRSQNFWILGAVCLLFLVLVLFLMRQDYFEIFRNAVQENLYWGAAVYVVLEIISVVVVPVATIVLVPVAVDIFGALETALMNIAGWNMGSALAFLAARHLALPLLNKVVDVGKINSYKKYISGKAEFWSIVALRMLLPVDILSYALGLFGSLSFGRYMLATVIGTTPFAFVYAYTGQILITGRYGLAVLTAVAALILLLPIAIWIVHKRRDAKEVTEPKDSINR